MQTVMPNLFLIGAMKSGTTYLNGLLNLHPDIFMAHPEEPSYFVDPNVLREEWPFMWEKGYWKSEENYLRLFEKVGKQTWVGEASTNYTKLPKIDGVVDRLHKFNPAARFIYLMRDPVERALSHYWHMVRYHYEPRKPLKAIQEDSQFVAVSNYAMQLHPYIETFGRESIFACTHEELIANTQQVLDTILAWLGLDALPEIRDTGLTTHKTPDSVEMARGTGFLFRLRSNRAYQFVHRCIPARVRNVAKQYAVADTHRENVPVDDVAKYLRDIQEPQVRELSQLLQREFPEWPRFHGADCR